MRLRQEVLDLDLPESVRVPDENFVTILEPSLGQRRRPHWIPDVGDIRALTYGIETIRVTNGAL